MDLHAVMIDGQFDARDQIDAAASSRIAGGGDSGQGVVVREGDRRQRDRGGLLDDDLWRIRSV